MYKIWKHTYIKFTSILKHLTSRNHPLTKNLLQKNHIQVNMIVLQNKTKQNEKNNCCIFSYFIILYYIHH
jgi:hypothetical protein